MKRTSVVSRQSIQRWARGTRHLFATCALAVAASAAFGQTYTITTLAGDGTAGLGDTSTPPVRFNFPAGVTVDTSGNVYVADSNNSRVRKITSGGVVTTL